MRAKTIQVAGQPRNRQPKTKRNRPVPITAARRADPRKANRDAGLQRACLDNRPAFGSHLAQNEASLYKISTLMGDLPEICRRHFAVLVPESMGAEVEFQATRPGECLHTRSLRAR